MKKILAFLVLLTMLGCNGGDKTTGQTTEAEKTTEAVKTESVVVSPPSKETELKILEVSTSSGEKPNIEITLSDEIGLNSDIDAYIKVDGETGYDIIKMKNKIVIKGDFYTGETYQIEILKGLKSKNGIVLKENFSTTVAFKEIEPKIAFSNEGIILPAVNDKRISFKSLNVKKVNVKVKKVYENNTTQFLQNLVFKGNGNVFNYSLQGDFYRIGDVLFEKEYELNNLKNKWIQTEIELGNLVDYKGFFIVELSFNKDGIDYTFPEGVESWQQYSFFENNGKIGKVILLSDMGILAQKTKDQYLVTVTNVAKNSVVKGAKVKAVTLNNQLIEEKTTNENGEVTFDGKDQIFYIISELGEEKSILKLNDSRLSYDGFAVDGIYATEGVKSFMYTDRGIYRPGDDIYLSIIARNADNNFPENHPVKLNIYTPTGKKFVENHVLNDGKNGFYTYSFKTNLDSETGIWRVDAQVGSTTFRKDIPVETIVPYKIKVDVDAPKVVDINENGNFEVKVASDYLFGAPGSDLRFNSELQIREENVRFEKFKNYTFTNPTSYNFYHRDYKEGTLNSEGKGTINFDIAKVTPKNINLTGTITTKVLETSGRPVLDRSVVTLKKFDTYIGMEIPSDRYMKSGDKVNLQVIAVSSDGDKLVPGRKMKYRIYKNEYSWWWDYNDYGSFLKSIKTDTNTTFVHEQEFVSGDKPYIIDYPIDGTGEIFVEVEDLETEQSTGVNLYVSTWMDPSVSKKVDKLKMETDKKSYNIGEKAKIIYEGEKGAKALITIEKSGQIVKRYWKDVNDIKNEEEIEVTEGMFPNAYVSISLFQDYNNFTNDRPLRLYGAVPLMVKNEATKLNLELNTPKELRPNEKFSVKVKNKAGTQMEYTVAVVDEGLLDITAFKTPDPWNYFYQKEALQIMAYDNYNEIIGKTFGEVHQVLKTGGGEFLAEMSAMDKSRNKQMGLEEAQRFKPVAMFKGVLTTNDKGEGEVEFTMPNYMGSVRVMVIGADKGMYGKAESTITVKAPIVMNASLPRTLKVGDEFKVPVEIFALEDELGEITVSINFNGETKTEKFTLKNKEKKTVYFTEKVPNKIGADKITINAKSNKYSYEEVTDIDINSNNPYIYLNDIKTVPGGKEVTFNAPKDSIEGSVESTLTISSSPILAIDQRLKWLIRYPYGCAEQTTSSVLPQLFIKELSSENAFDKKRITANINSGISRLSKFQLYDGSFTYWPGNRDADLWVTNYIGQFLISAKENGYYVPEDMYSRWLDFSKKQSKIAGGDLDRKAYTLYLLASAGSPEISEMNLIYENYMGSLSITSKWYMAAAYKLIGEDKMAVNIAGSLPITVPEYDYDYYRYSYGSNLRDKAIVLGAYYKVYGKIEEKLYNDILQALQSQSWLSTQSTGYSLMTIAEMVKSGAKEEVSGTIEIDGQLKRFTTKNGTYTESVSDKVKDIKIVSGNSKDMFVNYYWEGVPVNYEGENIAKNIKIERKFYDINGVEIDPKSLTSGTTFWLEVKVLPADNVRGYFYINEVALTQVLPTGWEIENVRALKQQYPEWIKTKMANTNIDYEDIRDDRVMWFFDFNNYSRTGNSFFIKVNTVTVGKYKFPGTMAEAMYDKNYEAYLKGFEVEVK